MTQRELVATLRRVGYVERTGAPTPQLSSYRLAGESRLVIHNGADVPADAGRTAEVLCSKGAITALRDPDRKAPLDGFAIRPELLSNVINKNREKRRYVRYRDLPKSLVDAVLASEDRRFFSHSGVDPIRILGALVADLRRDEHDPLQGGSTLTQQFVKNYFLTPEQTPKRKLSDAYMSILLEKRFSKEQIFELYCNDVYLGQRGSFSIVGFGEAAEAYFDHSVKELTLGEAATLAGIISAPNRYSPTRSLDRARVRRNIVLDQMAEYGMITPRERDAVKTSPLEVKPSSILNSDAPYFVDYVQDILVEKFGGAAIARSNYKVYTSLDAELTQVAYDALRRGAAELDAHFAKGKRAIPPGTVQASLIAIDPATGKVLVMIGGRNYGASQFNRITQSRRQPGSIFKPFVYAAALETAYTPGATPLTAVSTVVDEPTQFAFEKLIYEPGNFKNEYLGQVTMRQAISKSLNVATIKFAEKVGYQKVAALAHRLGLNDLIKPYPSIAIGAFEVTPLEMARAYTAFAHGGLLSELTPIVTVIDRKGSIAYAATAAPKQVLTPQVGYMVTSLLESVINHGTGAGARSRGFALPAAGKTGTSHDGWFAGYTPDLLCIVWVGFDDNRELNLSGSQAALPIWTDFMKAAAARRPLRGAPFTPPTGIIEVEIDPTTGLLATERCLDRQSERFIKDTEPVLACYGNSYEMLGGAPNMYAAPKDPALPTDNKNGVAEDKKKPVTFP
jgi:penicillin-binding protein 1B